MKRKRLNALGWLTMSIDFVIGYLTGIAVSSSISFYYLIYREDMDVKAEISRAFDAGVKAQKDIQVING